MEALQKGVLARLEGAVNPGESEQTPAPLYREGINNRFLPWGAAPDPPSIAFPEFSDGARTKFLQLYYM